VKDTQKVNIASSAVRWKKTVLALGPYHTDRIFEQDCSTEMRQCLVLSAVRVLVLTQSLCFASGLITTDSDSVTSFDLQADTVLPVSDRWVYLVCPQNGLDVALRTGAAEQWFDVDQRSFVCWNWRYTFGKLFTHLPSVCVKIIMTFLLLACASCRVI